MLTLLRRVLVRFDITKMLQHDSSLNLQRLQRPETVSQSHTPTQWNTHTHTHTWNRQIVLPCMCVLSALVLSVHTFNQNSVVMMVSVQSAVTDQLWKIYPFRSGLPVKGHVCLVKDFSVGWSRVASLIEPPKSSKQQLGLTNQDNVIR